MKINNNSFVFQYLYDWVANPARMRKQTNLPTVLNFPITDNCNSRCVMCDIWKTKSSGELSADSFGLILRDSLFRKIQHVGISGGEPTLRADLVDVIKVILASLKNLHSLSITSHGFHVARWKIFLPFIQEACKKRNVKFVLNLSLDGVGELHDEIRQIPGGYDRVMRTYQLAKEYGVQVKFQTTVSQPNLYGIGNILDVSNQLNVKTDFRVATDISRLDNIESMKDITLNDGERSFFADFLISPKLLSNTPSPARRLFYRDLSKRLVYGSQRTAPCHYQREGVLLSAHGDLYHCSISTYRLGNALDKSAYELYFSAESEKMREALIKMTCVGCLHDQSGAWHPFQLIQEVLSSINFFSRINKILVGIKLLLKALPSMLQAYFFTYKKKITNIKILDTLLLIGMYGGEHVGDAAILGGVIQRMKSKYSARRVYVASFRPDRTRRWVSSLSVDVEVIVIPLILGKTYMNKADGIVLAGGPVMDLTMVLLNHLMLIGHALAQKKPFVIEGVGVGPLKNHFNKLISRLIFSNASSIVLRSQNSSTHSVVSNLDLSVSDDPAFDYISSRVDVDKVPDVQLRQLQKIVTENTYQIAINLRPLWNKYVFTHRSADLESGFLYLFSQAIQSLSSDLKDKAKFYFYSMNSDQFGFSDLQSAYHLQKALPSGFPFSVWETEPDVDSLITFIRKMDLVIAMRFHAAIFAFSQNIPVLGIDYSVGKPGKVSNLFFERGLVEQVCRIDTFSTDWLSGNAIRMISNNNIQKNENTCYS